MINVIFNIAAFGGIAAGILGICVSLWALITKIRKNNEKNIEDINVLLEAVESDILLPSIFKIIIQQKLDDKKAKKEDVKLIEQKLENLSSEIKDILTVLKE